MRPEVFHMAFTNFPIDRIHSRCVNADENLVRLWLRTRCVFVTATLAVHRSGEFELLSWFEVSRQPNFYRTLCLGV
jgi:hypothetical protein